MDRGRYGEEPVRMFCNGEKKKKHAKTCCHVRSKVFRWDPQSSSGNRLCILYSIYGSYVLLSTIVKFVWKKGFYGIHVRNKYYFPFPLSFNAFNDALISFIINTE